MKEAKAATTYTELWRLFFTDEMLNLLVQYTNQKISDELEAKGYTAERLQKATHIRLTDEVTILISKFIRG